MAYKFKTTRFPCLIVALVYFVASSIWTLYSHQIFAYLLRKPELADCQAGPAHWFFIALTTGLLYWLLRYWDVIISESEESLRKVNRALKSFSECTKALTRTDDEQQLMSGICRICVEVGGHKMAWVALRKNDPEKSLVPGAHWGECGHFFTDLKVSWGHGVLGKGPSGTCVRTKKITIFQNLAGELPYEPWKNAVAQAGFSSCIALPLIDGNEAFGALVIFDEKKNAFDSEETELLAELAGDLAYGLTALRTKLARQREMAERLMLATVMDQASDGIITFNESGVIQYVNPRFVELCGIPADEGIGVSIHEFECSERNPEFYQTVLRVFAENKARSGHFVNKKRDGTFYDIDARIAPVFDENGKAIRYVAMVRDVTHEIDLERQLRQAQKMEALATLSGGIAHDFNNILAIILTNIEMCLEDIQPDDPTRRSLELVHKAGLRGKHLVKQFLTFSRKNEQPKKPVKMAELVRECISMLRPMLPATVEIRQSIDVDSGWINADPTQIHQVIMNLCTNADDAMRKRGGVLDISLTTTSITVPDQARFPGLPVGVYLKLTVSDTGHGMSRDILDRIFDPFFSTKSQGKGTGLGLSIAHGIIKNHGGHISVNSIIDVGTTFVVYLPLIASPHADPVTEEKDRTGTWTGRILFVDDEVDYCSGMKMMLERAGHEVTVVHDPKTTMNLVNQDPQAFDLLITDQTMPQMTGVAMAQELLEIRPDLPIILCTGASAEVDPAINTEKAKAVGIRKVLIKPVERQELKEAIQEVMDCGSQES